MRHALVLVLPLLSLGSSVVFASPSLDDNAGRWADTFTDDDALYCPDGTGLDPQTCGAEWDAAGRRVVLDAPGVPGTFLTGAIAPASFSSWGGVYLDYNAASDASVKVWVVSGTTVYGQGGATGTLANPPSPLPLGPSDRAGYNARAAVPNITASPLQVLVQLTGATLPPAINAIEVSWTPRSIVTMRLEAPATVRSAETIGVRVNAAVSFVDARDLVVEATLPVVRPNAASGAAYQPDQKVSFVSATHGGALSGDGTKVVWNLGTRKAGETFTLVYTTRTQMGLLDQILYDATATARPSNGSAAQVVLDPPVKIISSTAPSLERNFGAGAYRINNVDYVFPDTDLEVVVQGWNHRNYPASGGETLFDAFVWDQVDDLLVAASNGVFDISHGGRFKAPTSARPADVPVAVWDRIPNDSVYWRKDPTHWPTGHLTVGQGFRYTYKVHVGPITEGGPVSRGMILEACATLASAFTSQLADTAGPVCRGIRVDEPFEPSGIFAKGEQIRGIKQVGAGQDLQPPSFPTTVKAAFGETMSYHLLTYNSGVSRLDDIVMIDRIPEGMVFEDAFLPPEANGTIWYYLGDDHPDPNAPPSLGADGSLGAG